jgi:SRSO17 transposase
VTTIVNCTPVTARAHALFDFRLYLPKGRCRNHERRPRAQVPHDVAFQTKTELATGMIAGAVRAAVPFAWAAGVPSQARTASRRTAAAGESAGQPPMPHFGAPHVVLPSPPLR